MDITSSLPVLTRLTLVIDAFLTAMRGYLNPRHGTAWGTIPAIDPSVFTRVWNRMRHAERTLKSLMARFKAGKLRPAATRKPSTTPRTRTAPKIPPLPRQFAWFCALMPAEAAIRGNHINLVLADPEIQALLAASPRAIAVLKPICRMLAIHPSILIPGAPKLTIPIPATHPDQAEPPPPAPNPGPVFYQLRVLWRPQSDP